MLVATVEMSNTNFVLPFSINVSVCVVVLSVYQYIVMVMMMVTTAVCGK